MQHIICFISTLAHCQQILNLTQLLAALREITLYIFNNEANLLDDTSQSCFDLFFFFETQLTVLIYIENDAVMKQMMK